jgi:hypothetical protein
MAEYPIEGQRIICINDDWSSVSFGEPVPPNAPTAGSRWTITAICILDRHIESVSGVYLRLAESGLMWWTKDFFRPLDQIDEIADLIARVRLLEPV